MYQSDEDLLRQFDDFEVKTNRKVPVCLVLDTSGSMGDRDGTRLPKIEELNKNVKDFIDFVKKDPRARSICDLSIITFGSNVHVIQGYASIEEVKFTSLQANGSTPMGEAMSKASQLLELRRNFYKNNEIEHYKPIVLLMTDGEATDAYQTVAKEFSSKVKEKKVKILPILIGSGAGSEPLKAFSPLYPPKKIQSSEQFAELFRLLSSSTSNPAEDPWDKFMGLQGDTMD
jgi:uncharacterized protein YegL